MSPATAGLPPPRPFDGPGRLGQERNEVAKGRGGGYPILMPKQRHHCIECLGEATPDNPISRESLHTTCAVERSTREAIAANARRVAQEAKDAENRSLIKRRHGYGGFAHRMPGD